MSLLNKEEKSRMQEYCRILKATSTPEALTHEERRDITQLLDKLRPELAKENRVENKSQERELMVDLNMIEALLQKEGLIESDELIMDAELKLLKTKYFIVLKLIPKESNRDGNTGKAT